MDVVRRQGCDDKRKTKCEYERDNTSRQEPADEVSCIVLIECRPVVRIERSAALGAAMLREASERVVTGLATHDGISLPHDITAEESASLQSSESFQHDGREASK